MFTQDPARVPPARCVGEADRTDASVDGVAGRAQQKTLRCLATIVVGHLERKEVHDDRR